MLLRALDEVGIECDQELDAIRKGSASRSKVQGCEHMRWILDDRWPLWRGSKDGSAHTGWRILQTTLVDWRLL